jgi:hypothetical protein
MHQLFAKPPAPQAIVATRAFNTTNFPPVALAVKPLQAVLTAAPAPQLATIAAQ